MASLAPDRPPDKADPENVRPDPSDHPRTWDYLFADGTLAYRAEERPDGEVVYSRPTKDGKWARLKGDGLVPFRKPELAAADPAETVWVCRDEAEAVALAGRGPVATCAPRTSYWLDGDMAPHVAGRHVVIIGRADATGREQAEALARAIVGSAAEVKIIEPGGLKPRMGVGEWLERWGEVGDLLAEAENVEPFAPAMDGDDGETSATSDGGFAGSTGTPTQVSPFLAGGAPPPPRPIRAELHPVPAFDLKMMPGPLRPWVGDIAERIGCAPDFVAVGVAISIGTIVGGKATIRPKQHDDWEVTPNLWGAGVARPGFFKTPAIEESLKPLRRLAVEARDRYAQAVEDFKVSREVAQSKAEAAKAALKAAAKGKKSDEELRRLAAEATAEFDLSEPVEKRYIVNDVTTEKFGEILRDNPQGVLQYRDELNGFLRGLEKQGRESDRPFYLEGWNGGKPFDYDRIGRGSVPIPCLTISLLGSIQPGPLSRYIREAASGTKDDGFIPRFQLMVYPDQDREWVNVDRWPDTNAKNAAFAVFDALDKMDPIKLGATQGEGDPVPYFRFSPEAQEFFNGWRTDLEVNKLRTSQEEACIESHLAKYRSLMPSLALLFHLVDLVSRGASGPVSLAAAGLAAAWCDYLEQHARRVYQSAFDGDIEPAQRLVDRIKSSLSNPFRTGDVIKKGWSGLDSAEAVERAVAILEDHDCVRVVNIPPGPQGGRPKVEVWINPLLIGGEG